MKPFNLEPLNQYRQHYYQQSRVWLQQNWMKLCLMLLAAFILVKKDINVSFTLQNAIQSNELVHPPSIDQAEELRVEPVHQKETTKAKASFGIMDFGLSDNKSTAEVKTEKKSKKPKTNKANNFSNIAFILNPGYAERHQISSDIVNEKRRTCKEYIRRFAPVAAAEMHKYGIPASITLAQALLESNAGQSRLTRSSNNHFGIKCFKKNCKKGHCSNFTDDSHKDFFRKYDNAWQSYRAHSLFLHGKRYQSLFKYTSKDYRAWAKGLKKCGYATDKRYAEKLIQIIEELNLQEYDV